MSGACRSDRRNAGQPAQSSEPARPWSAANANLTGASIVDSQIEGMTIDGIAVSDMIAAYLAGPRT